MSEMKGKSGSPETGLSRRLGLFAATVVGIGVILGAGIYVLVGIAKKQAGNAAWLSFLISAAVAGFTVYPTPDSVVCGRKMLLNMAVRLGTMTSFPTTVIPKSPGNRLLPNPI